MTVTATISKAKSQKTIKLSGNYNDDLKLAIATGLFPAGARPKKSAVESAIEAYNKEGKTVVQPAATPPSVPAAIEATPDLKKTVEYVVHCVSGPTQSDLKGVISTPLPFDFSDGGAFRRVQIPTEVEQQQLKIYQDSGAYCMPEKTFTGEISEPGSLIVVPHQKIPATPIVKYYVANGQEFDVEDATSTETPYHWQDHGDLRLVAVPLSSDADQKELYLQNVSGVMTEAQFLEKLSKRSIDIVTRKAKSITIAGSKGKGAVKSKTAKLTVADKLEWAKRIEAQVKTSSVGEVATAMNKSSTYIGRICRAYQYSQIAGVSKALNDGKLTWSSLMKIAESAKTEAAILTLI